MDTRRNTALFFAAYFLEGLCFYAPVATLYRQAAGLTLAEMGVIESVSVALMLLLEIPWGRVADRLGHRRVIVLSTALYALSKVVFWRADGFGDFLLERVILAVALAGLSGCDSAYLYACGAPEEGQRRFGLWGAVQTAGLVTAGVCSTLFFGENYRAAAGWTVMTYGLAALLTLFLTEPQGAAPPAEERPPLRAALGWSLAHAPLLMGGGAALCLLLALLPLPGASVLGIMGLRAAGALFEPVSLDLQNAAAPPGGAAAQFSCNAMVMELTAAALNPAFGSAADLGTGWALLLGAAACGGGLVLFLYGMGRLK